MIIYLVFHHHLLIPMVCVSSNILSHPKENSCSRLFPLLWQDVRVYVMTLELASSTGIASASARERRQLQGYSLLGIELLTDSEELDDCPCAACLTRNPY